MVFKCYIRAHCAPDINWLSVSALMKLCFPGGEKLEISLGKTTEVAGRASETCKGGGRMLYLSVVAEESC